MLSLTRLREMAFLNKGLKIIFARHDSEEVETFHYEGGIGSYVEFLNKIKQFFTKNLSILIKLSVIFKLKLLMQYTESYAESVLSFANNINTHSGGTHLTGFRNSITRVLNDYARKITS